MSANSIAPTLRARAACRVDLAGGTLDIWPLYLLHPGAVTVNLAVTVPVECRIAPHKSRAIELISRDTGIRERFASLDALLAAKKHKHPLAAQMAGWFAPSGGFRMETYSASPAGAGISGSSALMIASAAALACYTGRTFSPEQLRVIAQNVEARLIGVPTGCQDYYPALYGGVGAIHLEVEGIRHEPLAVDLEEMNQRFVLAYTGKPHNSGINNWEVFQRRIAGDKKVIRNFEQIGAIARQMREALLAADWTATAALLRQEWRQRRTNAPGISTAFIDELIALSRKHGGVAAKVCGAGGGGCVIFQCQPGRRAELETALAAAGAEILPFAVEDSGVSVEEL
jgi:D-glycero-alpha-D-manno-heptose-7-phosphate kinase